MNLDNLVAISGKPGIYRMAANRPDGLIVEDVDSGKKMFVSGRIHQFTPLASISIYTETEDGTVDLPTVFRHMRDAYETTPPIGNKASADETRTYFGTVLPEFDRERVYVSDIKKLIKWFRFLYERDLLVDTEETDSEEADSSAEA